MVKHQFRKQAILQKEVMDVMGGKVLPLPSDKLREERERGIELGMELGMELGQLKGFVENIECLMRMQNWSLQQACEALGSTEEFYHQAKERLKDEV